MRECQRGLGGNGRSLANILATCRIVDHISDAEHPYRLGNVACDVCIPKDDRYRIIRGWVYEFGTLFVLSKTAAVSGLFQFAETARYNRHFPAFFKKAGNTIFVV